MEKQTGISLNQDDIDINWKPIQLTVEEYFKQKEEQKESILDTDFYNSFLGMECSGTMPYYDVFYGSGDMPQ